MAKSPYTVAGLGLIFIIVWLGILALEIWLVSYIWNKVLIKKFPASNIQKLSFWDSLGMIVLFNLLAGGGYHLHYYISDKVSV